MSFANLMELLHGGGKPLTGTLLSVGEAEAEAFIHFPEKPFCLVKEWILIDVEIRDGQATLYEFGMAPQVIYAAKVVLDSAGRRQPGDWVRSTFRRSFTDGYLFESIDTVYVLLGRGVRKSADMGTVLSIG